MEGDDMSDSPKWSDLPERVSYSGGPTAGLWGRNEGQYEEYIQDRCEELWLRECTLCGAIIDKTDRHTAWHKSQGF
jgi:hypothetical protein